MKAEFACLVLASVALPSRGQDPYFDLVRLEGAHCNDGTPAGIYVRPSAGNESSREPWVFFLEGGGWCYSLSTCESRFFKDDGRMSSGFWEEVLEIDDGIFSQDCNENPTWCNANHVYFRYCSSDGWIGTAANTDLGYSFEGSIIIDTAIEKLISGTATMPQLDPNSSKVLLTGCSAGGRGAMFNLDRVVETLPYTKGLLDSAWWLDIPPHQNSGTWLTEQVVRAYNLHEPNIDQTCLEAYGEAQGYNCYLAEYALPYVEAPAMSQVYQYDKALLDIAVRWDQGRWDDPDLLSYAETWRRETLLSIDAVGYASNPNRSVYAPACNDHCSGHTDYFTETLVSANGTMLTLEDALALFWSGEQVIAIDTCDGFGCGEGCNE
mmetsp:Transcript_6608/g.12456  ORF Transcript_6608/g.12456 Transcript_6608/m.12456 type:complete len:379 (-) Transcript_6608:32-1168(-)